MKNPLEVLLHETPDYTFLKVFRCACWSHTRPYNNHKLVFRSKKCVFLEYSSLHKGYKCLHISYNRLFISRDFIFYENIFLFLAFPTPSTPLFTCYAWSIWRCCTLPVVVALIMVQVFVVAHVFILRTSLTHRQMLLIWLMGRLHPRCLARHPLPRCLVQRPLTWCLAWLPLPDHTLRPTLCRLVRPQCPRRLVWPR
jgi:hypothetical protein